VKAKPPGPKYRNLTARGDVIYYERWIDGERYRFSCETSDWNAAAVTRDLYEQRRAEDRGEGAARGARPTFAEFAMRYLVEDTSHLASTTRSDREALLGPEGSLVRYFGAKRLDEVTPPVLRDWWNAQVLAKGRTTATGRSYLAALAGVLGYAQDLGFLASSPLGAFRDQLRRRGRTKGARAAADPTANIRPIESPAELGRFVAAAFAEAREDMARELRRTGQGGQTHRPLEERAGGLRALVAVLAMLDAGLRVGEVAGLTWGQVLWGADENDPTRALLIDRSRPRGGEEGPPKSGRARTVALSRRLRAALRELYALQFEPGPSIRVLAGFEPHNFTARAWRRILERAEIGHRSPKDLRDTFASWLLSLGVQLGYVSQQLGHADVAVTARHYARWCGGDVYREPMQLEAGEVPADFLARIAESPHGPLTFGESLVRDAENSSDREELMVAQARVELATPAFSVRCSTN
jgi:integrase